MVGIDYEGNRAFKLFAVLKFVYLDSFYLREEHIQKSVATC